MKSKTDGNLCDGPATVCSISKLNKTELQARIYEAVKRKETVCPQLFLPCYILPLKIYIYGKKARDVDQLIRRFFAASQKF